MTTSTRDIRKVLAGLAMLVLASCGDNTAILGGERLGTRDVDGQVTTNLARAFNAPAQVNHASWSHRGGSNTHKISHPALGTNLKQLWSVSIGKGTRRQARLTADPVVAGGRIFTMDSQSRVVATSLKGKMLWSSKLVPGSDRAGDASGGGLAYANGVLFASTGFGELYALVATSGQTIWVQQLDAPITSSPTVSEGSVYVVTRDSRAWAIGVNDGRIKWQLPGAATAEVLVGGSGPVVTNRLAIFPFGSGELVAALKSSGVRVWGSAVAGQRLGRAYSNIADISGDPVLYRDVLYAANQGGRVVALKPSSGERLWTANEGSYSPVWPSGDSIFMVSDQGELLRLDRATGERIWQTRLPYFVNRKVKRRQAIYAHFGPVLAGGRLIVASDDGLMRSFDPSNGALLATIKVSGGAASNPVVVGGTLYILTGRGKLAAFR